MTGQSANLMSLGGLAIAIGMLVDAAVVVVENTVTRLQPEAGSAHLPRLHRISAATREVATPVSAGILIIALTFLPLLTLEGLEGKLFAPVALTIVFALGASLLLSLTLVPVLASLLLNVHAHQEMCIRDRGRITLSAAQLKNLGITQAVAKAASVVPITGLPAQITAPLAASTEVTVPYAGVVTQVLVDEGAQVQRGQPMLRLQSRELVTVQAELARARAEAGVAQQQAGRDAVLLLSLIHI